MKSLVESLFDSKTQMTESLFDNDLSKKRILLGDVVELETWECANLEEYSVLGPVLDSTFSAKLKNKIIKLPKWKKFLSPFESIYNKPFSSLDIKQQARKYIGVWQLWTFTWVVMCCTSLKEIPIKLNEFMKEISRDINDEFGEDFHITKTDISPLEGLGDMKGLPRLVVIKFKVYGREIVVYMKLKKRD